jgi:hypothetical protein
MASATSMDSVNRGNTGDTENSRNIRNCEDTENCEDTGNTRDTGNRDRTLLVAALAGLGGIGCACLFFLWFTPPETAQASRSLLDPSLEPVPENYQSLFRFGSNPHYPSSFIHSCFGDLFLVAGSTKQFIPVINNARNISYLQFFLKVEPINGRTGNVQNGVTPEIFEVAEFDDTNADPVTEPKIVIVPIRDQNISGENIGFHPSMLPKNVQKDFLNTRWLAKSNLIPPGKMVSSFDTTYTLDPGEYKGTVQNVVFDPYGDCVGGVSYKVNVHVIRQDDYDRMQDWKNRKLQ